MPGGAKMELRHQIFEFLHRLFTGGRVEVAVYPQGGLDVLVAQPLAHQEDRGVELDQQRSVGVAQVVQPDGLHAGLFGRPQHLAPEVVLGIGEQSVVRLGLVQGRLILADVLAELVGQREHPPALVGLGVRDDLPPLDGLEGPLHRQRFGL